MKMLLCAVVLLVAAVSASVDEAEWKQNMEDRLSKLEESVNDMKEDVKSLKGNGRSSAATLSSLFGRHQLTPSGNGKTDEDPDLRGRAPKKLNSRYGMGLKPSRAEKNLVIHGADRKPVSEDDPQYKKTMEMLEGPNSLSKLMKMGGRHSKLMIKGPDGKLLSEDDPLYKKTMKMFQGPNSMSKLMKMGTMHVHRKLMIKGPDGKPLSEEDPLYKKTMKMLQDPHSLSKLMKMGSRHSKGMGSTDYSKQLRAAMLKKHMQKTGQGTNMFSHLGMAGSGQGHNGGTRANLFQSAKSDGEHTFTSHSESTLF